jgi:anaerobic selenocysteine-containing dehydrogenase
LRPAQELQLHPQDARRLGVDNDQEVDVASNGDSVRAKVRLRDSLRPGAAYLIAGTAEQNANLLDKGRPGVVEIREVER